MEEKEIPVPLAADNAPPGLRRSPRRSRTQTRTTTTTERTNATAASSSIPRVRRSTRNTTRNTTTNTRAAPRPRQTRAMAIKKHDLAGGDGDELDLIRLLHYIETLKNQNLQPTQYVQKFQEIVVCLSKSTITEEAAEWEYLQEIEVFLISMIPTTSPKLRKKIFNKTILKFYNLVADPAKTVCPAATSVLVIFNGDSVAMMETITMLVEKASSGAHPETMAYFLAAMYRWACQWEGNSALGEFLKCYIKALEVKERFDVLMEVSLENIDRLFLALEVPSIRETIADVILHILACCRVAAQALDKVAPHVDRVLVSLADTGGWSRTILQHLVDILTCMVTVISTKNAAERNAKAAEEKAKKAEEEQSKTITVTVTIEREDPEAVITKAPTAAPIVDYPEVRACLERHMPSRDCIYLSNSAWPLPMNSTRFQPEGGKSQVKVGLCNVGNICYMNSIMQALYLTRQFSNYAIYERTNNVYWCHLAALFTRMTLSCASHFNPTRFYNVMRPPYFTINNQQDSSEFLVYMFEKLHTNEFIHVNPSLNESPSTTTSGSGTNNSVEASVSESAATGSGRSSSPKPGSSNATAKRAMSPPDLGPVKKRGRLLDSDKSGKSSTSSKEDGSLFQRLFGGAVRTEIRCSVCDYASYSRDTFRQLQLAFPEKMNLRHMTVQKLVEFYCADERLHGDNRYQCDNCKDLVVANRSVRVEKPPNYLIVVLKNFRYEPKTQTHTKLMHNVYCNYHITLPSVAEVPVPSYDLYAAVVHEGPSIDSGHYFAIGFDGKEWFQYNDEVVSNTTKEEVNNLNNSSTPYILFYKTCGLEEPEPPSMESLPARMKYMMTAHNKQEKDAAESYLAAAASRP